MQPLALYNIVVRQVAGCVQAINSLAMPLPANKNQSAENPFGQLTACEVFLFLCLVHQSDRPIRSALIN